MTTPSLPTRETEGIKSLGSNKNSPSPSGKRQQYSFADELERVSMGSGAREDIRPLAAIISAEE
jgi:hypothetical protein